jgi:hypothetical protein
VLANVVHLSAYYFCRAFKQSFGIPLDRYHINRRIERAKTLLANPGPSETDIALELGFSETSSFSAAFRHTRLGPLQSTTAAPWHEAAPSQERRPKPAQQHLAGPQYMASRHETRCKLLDAHVGKADTLGGACGRSRRAPHPPLTIPSGDQPPSAYAGGSTALKTISMSCSGKASLDTPIRLLAHRGRATA